MLRKNNASLCASITIHIVLVCGILRHILFCTRTLNELHDLQVIKQRIESLIDREFLQRDADSQNAYKYLA